MTEFLALSREVEAASFAEMRLFASGRPVEWDAARQRLEDAKARFDAHARTMRA
ncbi:hypothetical protein [Sphingomonas sp. ABOLF]|uniref:hypothetical protein n=1 Tax=Sphingomonas sp. ABOLF TaxID=1985879 RepID=UPI0013E01E87|nr:hypothetical protein [Sphingomonas sp. ABOLF]